MSCPWGFARQHSPSSQYHPVLLRRKVVVVFLGSLQDNIVMLVGNIGDTSTVYELYRPVFVDSSNSSMVDTMQTQFVKTCPCTDLKLLSISRLRPVVWWRCVWYVDEHKNNRVRLNQGQRILSAHWNFRDFVCRAAERHLGVS